MNPSALAPPPIPPGRQVASPDKTLRRLFLTLFLRGRSSRGLQAKKAPKSIGQKLAITLAVYALFGFFALLFHGQSIFALSVTLHSMTFVLLGMFVASSAGEVLFNKEEVDILLHRPIGPRTLLWAKIRVVLEVSLWIAGALNLVGCFVGVADPAGGWRFPIVHAMSTVLEAIFCTGCVVMVYQLCLRWFGRERLDGLMTTAQVVVSVAAVLCGQIVPRVMFRFNNIITFSAKSWWIALLPPAWFAGLDDALAGSLAVGSWLLAAVGLIATATVSWIAFGKLARDYEIGLQRLSETVATRAGKRSRRWINILIDLPPMRWWLRDPVVRASFLLSAAYLFRDRDIKLRVYPGLGPFLIMPIVVLLPNVGQGGPERGGFGVAFAGCYLGIIPLMGLTMLQCSQQWQASDIFRAAPMNGPSALCDGARRAVFCFLALPVVAIFGLIVWLIHRDASELLLLLPGLIALPVFAILPNLGGRAAPLSLPAEDAKSAAGCLIMGGATAISGFLSGIALWSWSTGWFWWFVLAETTLAIVCYVVIQRSIATARWPSLE